MNQTDRDVTGAEVQPLSKGGGGGRRKIRVCMRGRLSPCVWKAASGKELTFADGAVSHVARLAGTQVSSDGVGADGVLITQILAAGALIVL